MPFQSEKQRRYLWANEPEIARDWTDTYGSRISKLYGGIMHPDARRGFPGGSGRAGDRAMPTGGSGANYGGPPGGGNRQMTYTAPRTPHYKEAEETKQFAIQEDIRRREAEKDYTRTGQIKPGPQLGLAGGAGPNLGSMASQFAGSKIAGGIGSMLFGPLGALLFSMFGRGVGKRAYGAYQTKNKKESLREILTPTFAQGLFGNKINQPSTGGEGLGLYTNRIKEPSPRGTGIETVDIRDKFDRRGDIKRSAKDYIDLDKSYWEGERFPTKYPGLDIARDYRPREEDLELDIGPYEGERYKITDMENI